MNHRIQRQSETFAYRMAGGLSSLFDLSPAAQGIGGGGKAKAIDALPQGDSAAPYEAMAQAEANRSGYQAPKMKVTPGAPSGGGGGGGSSAGSNGGVGSIDTGGRLLPGTQHLQDVLHSKYPGVTIGGWREDPAYPDEHPAGKALDFMTSDLNLGNQAMQLGFQNGADYAIWQNQMHYPDGRTTPYTGGSNPHTDHVHLHHPGGMPTPAATGGTNT